MTRGEGKTEKEEESLKAKVHAPGCGYLAIKALAAPKLFSWRGGLMDLYYLRLSGFQTDSINIQTLNSAGSGRH